MTTLESFESAARSSIWNRDGHAWFSPENVARRAHEQQSCIMHAANSLTLEHLDEAGYGSCDLCGGITAPNQQGRHGMCTARAARGMATPTLDSSPRCSCATCAGPLIASR